MSTAEACKMLVISEKTLWKLVETKGAYVHILLSIWHVQVQRYIHGFSIRNKGFELEDTRWGGYWCSFCMNTFHLCLAELVFRFLKLKRCCWHPVWNVALCSLGSYTVATARVTALDCELNCDVNVYRACSFMRRLEAGTIKQSSLYEDLKW